jgi:hypothetical protein
MGNAGSVPEELNPVAAMDCSRESGISLPQQNAAWIRFCGTGNTSMTVLMIRTMLVSTALCNNNGENTMKSIKILTACSLLMVSAATLAMNDPEMSYIDESPDVRDQPPAGIDTATLITATATVTAVDMENRLVTIEGPEGNSTIIQVTDQVKNLPQVKVGDKVNISYYSSKTVDIAKPGEDVTLGTEVGGLQGSAPAGEKPAGAAGVALKRTVEVVFVDPYQKFITFMSPDRGLRKISLKDSPDLQHYLTELKKGDVIEVTYIEAMAISVEPAE